jgi:hypothetical protein
MMEIANDPTQPPERRDMFLKECASYTCNKPRQTRAVELQVPNFMTVEEAESFLAHLAQQSAHQLEPQELTVVIRSWIESKRQGQELQVKLVNSGAAPDQRIVIEGGLPTLTGTNVDMPILHNGHTIDGTVIQPIESAHQSEVRTRRKMPQKRGKVPHPKWTWLWHLGSKLPRLNQSLPTRPYSRTDSRGTRFRLGWPDRQGRAPEIRREKRSEG